MIITIRSGEDLFPFGLDYSDDMILNKVHKKERLRIIENDFIIGKWVIHNTFVQEIIEEIVMIANEKGLLDQIELVRYDKGDPITKYIHYSGRELYNDIVIFNMPVI